MTTKINLIPSSKISSFLLFCFSNQQAKNQAKIFCKSSCKSSGYFNPYDIIIKTFMTYRNQSHNFQMHNTAKNKKNEKNRHLIVTLYANV